MISRANLEIYKNEKKKPLPLYSDFTYFTSDSYTGLLLGQFPGIFGHIIKML